MSTSPPAWRGHDDHHGCLDQTSCDFVGQQRLFPFTIATAGDHKICEETQSLSSSGVIILHEQVLACVRSAKLVKSQHLTSSSTARSHGPSYHRPLLVDQSQTILDLLKWFEGVSAKRDMPWRAAFIDRSEYPSATELREARKKRAYQVWISEIMLQQTRVETVKSYWLNWMGKWPTIEALASAPEEEVLAAWRGLGYYSRATRIHTAAKQVVADPSMDGLLPETPAELEKNVPGVGPYTAGAISSIVFGQPVPILDGNVARVLSRQLGLYANPKAKITTDLMWAAADVLVKKAYEVGEQKGTVPGEWNQALMELGSTVCTPLKPGCGDCPIRTTCRAYSEAEASTTKAKSKKQETETAVVDLEDLCTYCEPFSVRGGSRRSKQARRSQQTTPSDTLIRLSRPCDQGERRCQSGAGDASRRKSHSQVPDEAREEKDPTGGMPRLRY